MDTTQITHVSLCSGYGGIDLGLRRVFPGLRTIAYAEIEAFAVELLLARMEGGQLDAAPIWSNLKSFPWSSFHGMVDILSGGYPCQPFSSAGKRLGAEDPRHLWPYIRDGIERMAPRICFFENVEGHITLGLSTVISDLEELDYRTTWGIFSAAEVGAPHQRKRVFILAHCDGAGLEGLWQCCSTSRRETTTGHAGSSCDVWPSRPGEPQYAWEPPRVVANSISANNRIKIWRDQIEEQETGRPTSGAGRSGESMGDAAGIRSRGGPEDGHRQQPEMSGAGHENTSSERQTQSTLGGNANGPAGGLGHAELFTTCDNRTDELRLLGNGVVPVTAERAFRVLIDELNR